MDFGTAAPASQQQHGDVSFFGGSGGVATAATSPSTVRTAPTLDDADAAAVETSSSVGESGKECASEVAGNQVPATTAAAGRQRPPRQLGLFPAQQQKRESGADSNSSSSMLAMAQKCTRTAKNGREQQRAQKISDVIDQLKVMRFVTYLHKYCCCSMKWYLVSICTQEQLRVLI